MGGVGITLLDSICSLLVVCGAKIGYPLKFNIDTPNSHFGKEINFPRPIILGIYS